MKSARYWVICLMLVLSVLATARRRGREVSPARETLSLFPRVVAGSNGVDQAVDPHELSVLQAGDYLAREYDPADGSTPVYLFIGYFPSQKTGATIHSPRHCLPGSGWSFNSSEYKTLSDAQGSTHKVGEYVIQNGSSRAFVIYWYEAHGRSVASEFAAKWFMVLDALRMNRSDGSLVRVITPINENEDTGVAQRRSEKFVAGLWPELPRFLPK